MLLQQRYNGRMAEVVEADVHASVTAWEWGARHSAMRAVAWVPPPRSASCARALRARIAADGPV